MAPFSTAALSGGGSLGVPAIVIGEHHSLDELRRLASEADARVRRARCIFGSAVSDAGHTQTCVQAEPTRQHSDSNRSRRRPLVLCPDVLPSAQSQRTLLRGKGTPQSLAIPGKSP